MGQVTLYFDANREMCPIYNTQYALDLSETLHMDPISEQRIQMSEASCKCLHKLGGYFTSFRGEIDVKV